MPIDYSLYPPDWKDIRARILERAAHRCEQCGVANRAVGYRTADGEFRAVFRVLPGTRLANGAKVIRIVLTIAHLNHDVTDNDPAGLAALCQSCHNRHDVEHRKRNRMMTLRRKREKVQPPLLKWD